MIYDFTYRPITASILGAYVPLRIEGAPDHGTVADARVWADHYDVRIELTDRTGRLLWFVYPRWPAARADRLAINMPPMHGRSRMLRHRIFDTDSLIVMRGAEGAMAGKTAWLGAVGGHPLMQGYVARKMREEEDEARAVRDASLLGLDVAAERAQAKVDGETFAERIRRRVDVANAASRFGITAEEARELCDAWLRAWPETHDWFARADAIMQGFDGPVLIDFKRTKPTPVPAMDPTLCRRGLSGVDQTVLTALNGGAS